MRGTAPSGPNPQQMLKLESEIAEIKNMLMIQQKEQNAGFANSDAAAGIAAFDQMYGQDVSDAGSRQWPELNSMGAIESLKDKEELQRYVQQEKIIIKKAQEKLALCKQQYKRDKQKYESDDSLRMPGSADEQQRQKRALDQVKAQIEERVNKINEKVDKIKALEKKIQGK